MISLYADPTKNKNDIDKDVAEALRSAVEKTLNDVFGIDTQMEVWSLEKGPLALEPFVSCAVDMKDVDHSLNGAFILAFSHETIAKVLKVYGIPDNKSPDVINDAAEEIANMIYGMLKTTLNKMGHNFTMAIPSIVEKKQELSTQYQNDMKMILPFLADGHRGKAMITPLSE